MTTQPLWQKIKSRIDINNCFVDINRFKFGLLVQVNAIVHGYQIVASNLIPWGEVNRMGEVELVEMVSRGLNDDLRR